MAGVEGAGMEIEGRSFLQHLPGPRPGDGDDRARLGEVDDGGTCRVGSA